jgi:hypothetical protein
MTVPTFLNVRNPEFPGAIGPDESIDYFVESAVKELFRPVGGALTVMLAQSK